MLKLKISYTVWKVSKYGVISGQYFPVFSSNARSNGPEITSYLDNFHAVSVTHSEFCYDPSTLMAISVVLPAKQ